MRCELRRTLRFSLKRGRDNEVRGVNFSLEFHLALALVARVKIRWTNRFRAIKLNAKPCEDPVQLHSA